MFSVDELKEFLGTGNEWTSDLTCVPTVCEDTIDAHFVASNRQLNKGWIFKEEKYIRRIECSVLRGTDLLVLRSICLCSMRSGHYKQVVVVKVDVSAAVVQAHCDCVAGLSQRCQHVAGLLFAVRSIQSPSCTDMPCRWIAPTQGQNNLPMQPLQDITFKKHVVNKVVPAKPKRQLPATIPSLTHSDIEEFSKNIARDDPHLVYNRYSKSRSTPPCNTSIIPDTEDLHSERCSSIFREHFEKIVPLTSIERDSLCKKTLGQNENLAWTAERTGRLTASKFKTIVCCRKPDGLLRSILYPKRQEVLRPGDPRLYGLQNEDVAVTKYVHLMQLYDKDIEVTKTGLHVHEVHPFLGASPDRLVKDGNEVGQLEVKCPASKAGQTVQHACTDKAFCAELANGNVCLKRSHAYYYQVQGQLGVTGKPWCDFVICTNHPELHHCLSVERIYFDKDFWKEMCEGLLYFYRFAVIPELLTRRIRRLGFLYTTGPGYVSFQKYKDGFYFVTEQDGAFRFKLRKLK
ncbi:uncharacterized protein LOC135387680 [Ornithodoros turicata]|uniref:uncharacterized protein LOC135387680 n=1 Tax=Ornithodoros turicata TaxID=34597 RepID=UPI00313A17EA